ncbi:hypothetical protein ARMSODRAFT_1052360 [Armillaria solidipes]|uniref:F-box domain-containing protein n=1 Tax=Armillaria solidipes TaxID=1076256 RepID=A0A2H3B7S3_9AGAR|nr:hypothetical protein ARMSODRAFT_1052360 [Armillaria solidipes]
MSSLVPILPVEIIELILATLWSSSDLNVKERFSFMKSSLYVCQTWRLTFLRISLTDVHILSIPYLAYILGLLFKEPTTDLAVYLISHCRSITMHPIYIRERLFKCLPHVRRVTLLCHNVSTNPPLNITWDYNVFFPPNVELLDMLFSYNTTEKPFDQEPCHRFYSKNHYYEPEFYSPNSPIRFDGLKDYAPKLEMPYIRHLIIYGANPAMVILTIQLFPALETLHTDIDSAVLKAGFDAANVRPTEGHIYEI